MWPASMVNLECWIPMSGWGMAASHAASSFNTLCCGKEKGCEETTADKFKEETGEGFILCFHAAVSQS